MSDDTRAELLHAVEELGAHCPDYRFGQLLANLATIAGVTLWDADDRELLEAARTHLRDIKQRHATTR